MQVTTKITVDMTRQNVGQRINAVQGDGNTRLVEITLLSGGAPWTPPDGVEAAIAYMQPGGTKGLYNKLADGTAAISISGNIATVILAPQMLVVSGTVQASLVFNDAQLNRLTTFPFAVSVTSNPSAGAQKVEAYLRLQWLEDKLDEYLRKASDSGEFDGAPGPQGEPGPRGPQGESAVVDDTLTISGAAADAKKVGDSLSHIKDDLDDYKDSISEYHKPVNLFDKSKITDGKILQGRNNEQTISSCFYTDYIPVEGGKTYCFQDNTGYLGQNGKVICCYDANKTFISSIQQSSVIVRDGAVIFSINKAKYVRVNGRTSRIDSFMFVEGETLPEYKPYYAPCYEIKENVLPRFVKTVNGVTPDENGNVNTNQYGNMLYNPLYGKKLCVDGDSIMYGDGSSGGFAKIIGDNNSMTVVNNAISGGTIASGTYHSDGTTARHCICDTIKNIPSDADYILFDGGVNDSSATAEVGVISSGFSAELDTTTFCGAMESICKWLVINRPNAKTGYVIVHKMTGDYTSEYPVDGQRDLYKLAIKICEKWGIPYIDLNTQVPPLKDIQSLRDVYTSNADGWHPNELGYKTFYVPKIEAFLRTL